MRNGARNRRAVSASRTARPCSTRGSALRGAPTSVVPPIRFRASRPLREHVGVPARLSARPQAATPRQSAWTDRMSIPESPCVVRLPTCRLHAHMRARSRRTGVARPIGRLVRSPKHPMCRVRSPSRVVPSPRPPTRRGCRAIADRRKTSCVRPWRRPVRDPHMVESSGTRASASQAGPIASTSRR